MSADFASSPCPGGVAAHQVPGSPPGGRERRVAVEVDHARGGGRLLDTARDGRALIVQVNARSSAASPAVDWALHALSGEGAAIAPPGPASRVLRGEREAAPLPLPDTWPRPKRAVSLFGKCCDEVDWHGEQQAHGERQKGPRETQLLLLHPWNARVLWVLLLDLLKRPESYRSRIGRKEGPAGCRQPRVP